MLPHSGHDYTLLIRRWKAVAERAGVELRLLNEAGGYPVFVVENEQAAAREPGGIYLSAGVHGDECAPVWALLQWMESDPEILRRLPVVIFPCINPSGFVENTRRDREGIDLNRCFENSAHPVIGSWHTFMEGRQFDLALNLHEDYDAGGIYLYELAREDSKGNELLSACEKIIPRETASTVDGSDFNHGLLTRSGDLERLVEEELGGGYPEAILLFLRYSRNSYTFETPSEFDLIRRIEAHEAFLEAATKPLMEGA
ncbi:MAG: M14 family metallocarboxypeptidase [Verrucomicrobiales bacterium]